MTRGAQSVLRSSIFSSDWVFDSPLLSFLLLLLMAQVLLPCTVEDTAPCDQATLPSDCTGPADNMRSICDSCSIPLWSFPLCSPLLCSTLASSALEGFQLAFPAQPALPSGACSTLWVATMPHFAEGRSILERARLGVSSLISRSLLPTVSTCVNFLRKRLSYQSILIFVFVLFLNVYKR